MNWEPVETIRSQSFHAMELIMTWDEKPEEKETNVSIHLATAIINIGEPEDMRRLGYTHWCRLKNPSGEAMVW